jgi:hypothetical protein
MRPEKMLQRSNVAEHSQNANYEMSSREFIDLLCLDVRRLDDRPPFCNLGFLQ